MHSLSCSFSLVVFVIQEDSVSAWVAIQCTSPVPCSSSGEAPPCAGSYMRRPWSCFSSRQTSQINSRCWPFFLSLEHGGRVSSWSGLLWQMVSPILSPWKLQYCLMVSYLLSIKRTTTTTTKTERETQCCKTTISSFNTDKRE